MQSGTMETPRSATWSLAELRPDDVAGVRKEVTTTVTDWGYVPDDVAIVVSELVTNLVLHAGGHGALEISDYNRAVFISLTDRHPTLPVSGKPDWSEESGRGLDIVQALSLSLGVLPTRTGKLVWAVVPCPEIPQEPPEDDDSGWGAVVAPGASNWFGTP